MSRRLASDSVVERLRDQFARCTFQPAFTLPIELTIRPRGRQSPCFTRDSGKTRRAGEGTRTLDIQLGKLALYQLSYARERTRSKPACHSNRPRKCNYRHSKPIRNPCRFRRRDGHYRDDTEPQQNLAPPKNPGTFPRPRTVRGNFGDPDDLFGRCIFHDDWLGDCYRARMFRKYDSRPARRRRD